MHLRWQFGRTCKIAWCSNTYFPHCIWYMYIWLINTAGLVRKWFLFQDCWYLHLLSWSRFLSLVVSWCVKWKTRNGARVECVTKQFLLCSSPILSFRLVAWWHTKLDAFLVLELVPLEMKYTNYTNFYLKQKFGLLDDNYLTAVLKE